MKNFKKIIFVFITFFIAIYVALNFNKLKATINPPDQVLAGEIVKRMQENITCDWRTETVDTFKGGGPENKITGIATTFLANFDVLKRAREKGLNMIITHEPTFYNHLDETTQYGENAVLAAKQKYIKDNGLVVFRFHDHWHCTKPDGIYEGIINHLGWKAYQQTGNPSLFKIKSTTLKELSDFLSVKYNSNLIRVIGDPHMTIENVAMSAGAAGSMREIGLLEIEEVEVLIVGETREWETVEYVRDAITAGQKKALIIAGHANSEELGMAYCADWLRTFISEIPIEFVASGEPYWNPQNVE